MIKTSHFDNFYKISDEEWNPNSLVATESTQFLVRPMWAVDAVPSKSPLPPPLPKRPEMRQRSPPDLSASPPPLPMFSREKFEGVRQKWEKLDHQYVKQSHDSLDDGYRSREAAEADYRLACGDVWYFMVSKAEWHSWLIVGDVLSMSRKYSIVRRAGTLMKLHYLTQVYKVD